MSVLIVGFLIGIGVVAVLGFHSDGAVRSVSRIILFLSFAVFAAVTALCLYGAFAWSSKGAGPLMFFAIPPGFIALILLNFFLASVSHEPYFELSDDEKAAYTRDQINELQLEFQQSIERNTEQLNRFWTLPAKRRALRDEIAHAQFMLHKLAETERPMPQAHLFGRRRA